MSENVTEAPVPVAVGQTWRFKEGFGRGIGVSYEEFTISVLAPMTLRFSDGLDWEIGPGLRNIATLIRSPDTKNSEAGRFPPQAGDVWRDKTRGELTFTGEVNDWHQWLVTEPAYGYMERRFTDGTLTFVRHATPIPAPVPAPVLVPGKGRIVSTTPLDTYETRQQALVAKTNTLIEKLKIKAGYPVCVSCGGVFDKVLKSGRCKGCWRKNWDGGVI